MISTLNAVLPIIDRSRPRAVTREIALGLECELIYLGVYQPKGGRVGGARWTVKVSNVTDGALRTFLAARGRKKGDLSRFVEEAVNLEILRQTVRDARARNVDLNSSELEAIVAEEFVELRPTFWADHRH